MPYATSTDGVRINFETFGDGPPLVLIHGLTGTWQSWEAQGYVEALQSTYRLILIDLRGHGGSDKPHDRAVYQLAQQADDARAVLDALEIASAHVWALALGVRVAFHLAARYPDRVESLVLRGGHPYPSTSDDLQACHSIIATLREGMDAWITRIGATGIRRQLLQAADADALIASTYGEMDDRGVADSLARMTMPCLFLVGELDDANELAWQAAKVLPHADYVSVGGLGHFMWPSQTSLPYVRAFFERVRAGAFAST